MTPVTQHPGTAAGARSGATTISSARPGASVDTSQRVKRYAVTMAFRTACFLLAVTVAHGWLQWVLFAGAVFLPYLGVLIANQADEKGLRRTVLDDAPEGTRQLTSAPGPDVLDGVVVEGDVLGPATDDDGHLAGARR